MISIERASLGVRGKRRSLRRHGRCGFLATPDTGTPNDDAVAEAESIPANSHAELFVKPDDWFEVNEVSDRCGEVVEQLRAAFDEFAAACRADEPVVLAPLREELVLGLD